jgi:hypothetical protein
MTPRPVSARHWRSYGNDPLPTGAEALDEPFRAFPSWFLRIECDRCGKVSMLNEAHTTGRRREMPIRDLIAKLRHDGCGGIAGNAELLTGIEGVSGPPVRRIILR